MKVSKKIIALIFIIFSLTIAYTYLAIADKKYVLTNIECPKIDSIEIFHNNDSLSYNIGDSKCTNILKYIKNTIKKGHFYFLDGCTMFDDCFAQNSSKKDPDDYLIKINFISNTEVNLNDTSITCKYFIIDIHEKKLYYWIQASSTISEMTIEDIDLNNLKEFIKKDYWK